MIPLFIGIIVVGIGLALYGLLSNGNNKAKTESKVKEVKAAAVAAEELETLNAELEKIKAEYLSLNQQFETVKKKETELQAELQRKQEWFNKNEEEFKKIKERNVELEKKFGDKETEIKDLFSKNVDFNKKLKEAGDKVSLLEADSRQKSDQIEAFKHQLEKYAKEAQEHAATAAELKKKEDLSEWVPKQDFLKLQEELKARDAKMRALVEELLAVKKQLVASARFEEPKQGEPNQDVQS